MTSHDLQPTAADELAEVLAEVKRIQAQTRRLVKDVMSGGYLSASMHAGLGHWSARQTAARLIACLAFSAVRNGDKVGLIAYRGEVAAYVPPAKGAGHALRIVRDALALPCTGPASDPRPALDLATRAQRRHAVVFLVSDFLAPASGGAGGAGGVSLRRCARRHDVVAVRLFAPELDPPPVGLVRLCDPESGGLLTLDLGSRRVRAAWQERVAAWKRGLDDELRRARVDALDVPIPRGPGGDPIGGPIVRFFRMRELRGTKR